MHRIWYCVQNSPFPAEFPLGFLKRVVCLASALKCVRTLSHLCASMHVCGMTIPRWPLSAAVFFYREDGIAGGGLGGAISIICIGNLNKNIPLKEVL